MSDRVLVTGISGFIGSHTAVKLLEKGFSVRGTIRDRAKGARVSAQICRAAQVDENSIELVETELTSDNGWTEAVQDCRYIQHIASPVPLEPPKDREGLVPEARAGAQRVLEAGFGAGAERIVMTSSIASMIGQRSRPKYFKFGEEAWSDPEWKKQSAYPVSKTRAELSAWAYAAAQGLKDKLVTVNPGMVFGPDPFENGSSSLQVVRALMNKDFPRAPKLAFPIADVRDVAAIHVAAMTAEKAGGRRLIAAGNTLSFKEMSDVLRGAYPKMKLPSGELPNWLLGLIAKFDDRLITVLADLGIRHEADYAYVTNLTQVMPRPAKEAILATAEALIVQGLVEV